MNMDIWEIAGLINNSQISSENKRAYIDAACIAHNAAAAAPAVFDAVGATDAADKAMANMTYVFDQIISDIS